MDPTTPDLFFPPFLGENNQKDRDISAKKAFSRPRFEKCGLTERTFQNAVEKKPSSPIYLDPSGCFLPKMVERIDPVSLGPSVPPSEHL
jgi:hypothetical protein